MTPGRSAAIRRPLREDHLGASTYVEKGWHLIAAGEYPEAEAAVARALELAPSDTTARSLLGWAMMLQGRYPDAMRVLTELLREDPRHAMAHANLGYVCLRLGHLGSAKQHLTNASQQLRDPKAALYANFYLGLYFIEEGLWSEAERAFRRALELAPNFIEAYYELGRAQLFEGRKEDARATWKSGHAANRFSVWGKRCAEALQCEEMGKEPPSYS
jgi:tetratricopeptide (TPR) repeat protein